MVDEKKVLRVTVEEQTIISDALLEYANEMEVAIGRALVSRYAALLQQRLQVIRDLADRIGEA